MNSDSRPYRSELSAAERIAAIRGLLDEQRSAERLLCRYLADLADRVHETRLGVAIGFSDIYNASRCLFAMGVRRTREHVRIGRALRELPRIEQAFLDGTLSY